MKEAKKCKNSGSGKQEEEEEEASSEDVENISSNVPDKVHVSEPSSDIRRSSKAMFQPKQVERLKSRKEDQMADKA